MTDTDDEPRTWHHGLVARWWAEFTMAAPDELAYFEAAIRRFGEPALDLACGTGRLLLPLLAAGLDVEGADISPDMIAEARRGADVLGLTPTLHVTALHELRTGRRYRTVYCCNSFGLGGHRTQDLAALRRVFDHLEPGGAFVFNHYLPTDDEDPDSWARWLPGHGGTYPRDWPVDGDRRRTAEGDELELRTRAVAFEPFLQRRTLGIRTTLWHDGAEVRTEEGLLHENLYFAQELLLMLEIAGFRDVQVEDRYRGRPATPDATRVVFVARRAPG